MEGHASEGQTKREGCDTARRSKIWCSKSHETPVKLDITQRGDFCFNILCDDTLVAPTARLI